MSKASKKYDELLDELKKVTITHYQIKKETEELKKIHKLQIADLEAKLAESDSELKKQKEKYDKLYGCYKKTSSEDLQDKYRLANEIEQLKQQLAEKDKEIEDIRNTHIYRFYLDKDKVQDVYMTDVMLKVFNQDKISFAVEKLSLLKSQIIEKRRLYKGKFSEFSNGINDALYDVEEDIDNLIEELKKEIK